MASKAARANISSAIGAVSVLVPIRDKSAGWIVKSKPVNYYPGETAEDAESFGAEIFASLRALRDRRTAELAEPTEPVAPCHHEGPSNAYGAGDRTGPHVAGCKYLEPRGPFANIPFVTEPEPVKAVHKARAPRAMARVATRAEIAASAPIAIAEPAPEPVEWTCAECDGRSYPLPVVSHAIYHAEQPVMAPDAMTLCNACELRPMVGPEHPGYAAGYCAECYQDAETPEPIGPIETAAAERAIAEPAPVLTVVQPAERPTCERCGQVFRLHGTGAEWHRANRPDCATRRLAVVA